jgi:hypothetical protein
MAALLFVVLIFKPRGTAPIVPTMPQTTRADCAGSSGDLLPPSPLAEKTTARQEQAGQTSADDGAGTATPVSEKLVLGE